MRKVSYFFSMMSAKGIAESSEESENQMAIRIPSKEAMPLVRMLEAIGMPADSKSATLRMAVNDVVTVDVQFMPKNLEGMGDAIGLVEETYILIRKDSPENKIHIKASKFIKLRAEKNELKKKRNALMRQCLGITDRDNPIKRDGRPCLFRDSPEPCEFCDEADGYHRDYLNAAAKTSGALNSLRHAVQKKARKEYK